ncbi:AAA family ATPase [Mumia zhuanghuii]|uniref:AAA family ATPase n=2 Tax=Mumia TaxID=1546255 RepID=A0ABW1QRT1_9ACTN|nr:MULTISPECIES: LuxR family transcriptional regulator [Mumia]KAA1425099.1 AAA family ATPase [Mumia zhuanghuii]
MLIGRDEELAILATSVADAFAGRSRVTVVAGAPGCGKSALLDAATEELAPEVTVLRAAGHVAESDLPYAGLHQLLAPYEPILAAHPDPRAHALAAAVAFSLGDPAERLPVASSLVWFLSELASSGPVAVAVDDVQWLDASTRQALVFAARRLDADRVAFWFVTREPVSEELRGVGTTIVLPPLSREESLSLLRLRHPGMSAVVAERIAVEAGGLPLALAEAPLDLRDEQRRGREPLPERLRIGPSLESLYAPRIEALSDSGRFAVLLVALDDLDRDATARALEAAGLAPDDLDRAERLGLVTPRDGGWVPVHPTLGAAVLGVATAGDLDRAHSILADCFRDDPVRHAAHLRHVGQVAAPRIVAALVAAAEQATRQGAPAEAALAWEAAAAHETSVPGRGDLLALAAQAYMQARAAGPAVRLLRTLVTDAPDELARARWATLLVMAVLWSQDEPPAESDELARLGLDLVRRGDEAALVGRELVVALVSLGMAWGDLAPATGYADQLRTLVAPQQIPAEHRALLDVLDLMVGAEGAGAFLRGGWLASVDGDRSDPTLALGFAGLGLAHLGDLDGCVEVARRCEELARVTGGESAARLSSNAITMIVWERRGEWSRAVLELSAAGQAARDHDFTGPYAHILLRHAYIRACQGLGDACRTLLARGREVTERQSPALAHSEACVRGMLALSTADFATAAEILEHAAALERATGGENLAYTSRFVNQFEAYWHCGREAELLDELEAYEARAGRDQHALSLAWAARCRALLSGPAELDAGFERAVRLHDEATYGFERARAQLSWGLRLRRLRRKADARVQLDAALSEFVRLGAEAWEARTRSELAACGSRRAHVDDAASPLAALTPREFEVAREVGAGMSNADAAERLVISQRTVEYHLASVFRKLGIRERAALATYFD